MSINNHTLNPEGPCFCPDAFEATDRVYQFVLQKLSEVVRSWDIADYRTPGIRASNCSDSLFRWRWILTISAYMIFTPGEVNLGAFCAPVADKHCNGGFFLLNNQSLQGTDIEYVCDQVRKVRRD